MSEISGYLKASNYSLLNSPKPHGKMKGFPIFPLKPLLLNPDASDGVNYLARGGQEVDWPQPTNLALFSVQRRLHETQIRCQGKNAKGLRLDGLLSGGSNDIPLNPGWLIGILMYNNSLFWSPYNWAPFRRLRRLPITWTFHESSGGCPGWNLLSFQAFLGRVFFRVLELTSSQKLLGSLGTGDILLHIP